MSSPPLSLLTDANTPGKTQKPFAAAASYPRKTSSASCNPAATIINQQFTLKHSICPQITRKHTVSTLKVPHGTKQLAQTESTLKCIRGVSFYRSPSLTSGKKLSDESDSVPSNVPQGCLFRSTNERMKFAVRLTDHYVSFPTSEQLMKSVSL